MLNMSWDSMFHFVIGISITHSCMVSKEYSNSRVPNDESLMETMCFIGEELIVDEFVKVVATPGHTMSDVSVLVQTDDLGLVAVTGRCSKCIFCCNLRQMR